MNVNFHYLESAEGGDLLLLIQSRASSRQRHQATVIRSQMLGNEFIAGRTSITANDFVSGFRSPS